MKKISIYITLSLLILTMGSLTALAAAADDDDAPPSLIIDFEDEEDESPPSLSITPPDTGSTPTPPKIPSPNGSTPIPDPKLAAATLATNNNSIDISKTGPETGYLILASLILGYFANSYYKKVSAQKSTNYK